MSSELKPRYELVPCREQIGGSTRLWWEIREPGRARQDQVCHCADEEDARMIFDILTQAAIAAMSEPTEAMVRAGRIAWIPRDTNLDDKIKRVWTAMARVAAQEASDVG